MSLSRKGATITMDIEVETNGDGGYAQLKVGNSTIRCTGAINGSSCGYIISYNGQPVITANSMVFEAIAKTMAMEFGKLVEPQDRRTEAEKKQAEEEEEERLKKYEFKTRPKTETEVN